MIVLIYKNILRINPILTEDRVIGSANRSYIHDLLNILYMAFCYNCCTQNPKSKQRRTQAFSRG
jgi:hypothetical protein